jgi:hypothetical protein
MPEQENVIAEKWRGEIVYVTMKGPIINILTNLLVIIIVEFDVIDKPMTRYSGFVKYLRKIGIHLLLIKFITVYYSVRNKVLYNTLNEFGTVYIHEKS